MNPARRPLPLDFFLLVFLLSAPFYLLGASGGRLPFLTAQPASALMAFMPMIAALILVYRVNGGQAQERNGPMTDDANQVKERLPAAVYDLALRLGARPGESRSTVKLTQTGRIKRNIDTESWMAFTATQTISTRVCEFDWRAQAGPLGIISARDTLKDDEGRFDIMALGVIAIARAEHSAALMRGELMRYLAELVWAPHAILLNTALRWRVDGPDMLAVSAGVGDTASEVFLNLDINGRIAGAFAP